MVHEWNGEIGSEELLLLAQLQIELLIRSGKLGGEFAQSPPMSQQNFEEASELLAKAKRLNLRIDSDIWFEIFLKLYAGDMNKVRTVLYQAVSLTTTH